MGTGRRLCTLALVIVLGASTVACHSDPGSKGSTAADPAGCVDAAGTRVRTRLTIATDSPALTPWFVGQPSSGKGFEGALALALAKELGFAPSEVRWVSVAQADIVAAGRKDFDLALDQVVGKRVPTGQVDLSTGYYRVPMALIAPAGGAAAKATTVSELRALRLGALVGSPADTYVADVLKPTTPVSEYGVESEADAQVAAGDLDGLVMELPQAVRAAEGSQGALALAGQFPATTDAPQFTAVLAKGSPLTACVDQALAKLGEAGTVERLRTRWVGPSTTRNLPRP